MQSWVGLVSPLGFMVPRLVFPGFVREVSNQRKMLKVTEIQFIGTEVAIKFEDESEGYIPMDSLRSLSPSAETQGERDLMGEQISPDQKGRDFSGVNVTGWAPVGGYAIQFTFSDGHNTGIYSFDYLKEITSA